MEITSYRNFLIIRKVVCIMIIAVCIGLMYMIMIITVGLLVAAGVAGCIAKQRKRCV